MCCPIFRASSLRETAPGLEERMTRDQLKATIAQLAGEFDTMSESLWNETMDMADVEISCSVETKQIVLTIRDLVEE